CATAYALARAGCAVTLLERATPGAEASGAAAGMLTLLGESGQSPFEDLAIASWRLYPKVAEELREQTGIDVEHVTRGTIYPLFTAEDVLHAEARAARHPAKDFGIEAWDAGQVRDREPALASSVDGPARRVIRRAAARRAEARPDACAHPRAARPAPLCARGERLSGPAPLGRAPRRRDGRARRLPGRRHGQGDRRASPRGARAGTRAQRPPDQPHVVRIPPVGARQPPGARAVARRRRALGCDRALQERYPARADHGPAHDARGHRGP